MQLYLNTTITRNDETDGYREWDIPVNVRVDYRPARPAPICFNHDDPKFSDLGDPEFFEIESISVSESIDPFRKGDLFSIERLPADWVAGIQLLAIQAFEDEADSQFEE